MNRQQRWKNRLALAGLAAADAACLVVLRPSAGVLAGLVAPHRWLAQVGADRAVAGLAGAALWLVGVWLALGLAAWAAGGLPGRLGRCADRLARLVLPRAVYRIAAGAAGLGVLLSPVAAAAHGTGSRPATPATAGQPGRTNLPAPVWPTVQPVRAPHWPLSAAPRTPVAAHRDVRPVTVEPGDSLWSIAAAWLPGRPTASRIAAAWPRWYAANRAEIGPDPALIRPGQALRPPAPPEEHRS